MNPQDPSIQFGRVLDERSSDRHVWYFIVPGVLALAALIVLAGFSISRASGLRTQVRLAQQQAEEAQKAVDERDKLLLKARADEVVLRSPGQGAAVLSATRRDSPASGVAMTHPAHHAIKVYAFGLVAPPPGQEYAVVAIAGDQRVPAGALTPDEKGAAFLLAKDVPEGVSRVEVTLAPAAAKDAKPDGGAAKPGAGGGTVVLAGTLPQAGQTGVSVEAPPVQARSAPARHR